MATELTIPGPISEAAAQLAQRLGVSLTDLYTAALESYLVAYQAIDVTEVLDKVYADEPSSMDPVLLGLQFASLGGESW